LRAVNFATQASLAAVHGGELAPEAVQTATASGHFFFESLTATTFFFSAFGLH